VVVTPRDHEGIERYFAGSKRRQNCIPNNVREWSNFFDIYEKHAGKTPRELDNSFAGIKAGDVRALHPMSGDSYKTSPWECAVDIDNPDTLAAFESFGFGLSIFKEVNRMYSHIVRCDLTYLKIKKSLVGSPGSLRVGVTLPRHVAGSLMAVGMSLTSMEGFPETVGGDVNVSANLLETLEFCPSEVGGFFDCSSNLLTDLRGGPKFVSGRYDASKCRLASLDGGPEIVGQSFVVSYNPLRDLSGGPRVVGGDYRLTKCMDLKSLDGVAEYVGKSLVLSVEVTGTGPKLVSGGCTFVNKIPDGNKRMWGHIYVDTTGKRTY
jgi:hypothetical protein